MAHTVVHESGGGIEEGKKLGNDFVTRTELFDILKQISTVSQFYELEVFEVMDIARENGSILEPGVVKGRYIGYEHHKDAGAIIEFKPLNPNILQQPVVGELWLGISYTIGRETPHYIGRVAKNASLVNTSYFNTGVGNEERSIDSVKPGQQVLNSLRKFEDYKQGAYFKNVSPQKLFANEGDTIFQGRFGNTIRLGSNQISNTVDDEGNLRTGELFTKYDYSSNIKLVAGLQSGEEDLIDDKSSIYLTTKEFVDYPEPSNTWIAERDYEEPQLVFDSDRIIINAKKDVVGIFAQKDVHINAVEGDVHINAQDKIVFKPQNSEIINDIAGQGVKGVIKTKTMEDGVFFPELNMAGFLKQTMGATKAFEGLVAGVPLLPSPIGIKKIVKGLKGAEDFIEATKNFEFLSETQLESQKMDDIIAALPIPAGFTGVIEDIANITDEQIAQLEELQDEWKKTAEKADKIQEAINSGDKDTVKGALEGIDIGDLPGAQDILRATEGSDEDFERFIEGGGTSTFTTTQSDLSEKVGSADDARSYQKLFKQVRSKNKNEQE
mgnify:CR=1 FL=1|tara:strand:+ start:190 stop:1848 length:1659 start_codon:yes stop_codon:yes gene_type:complete